MIRATNLGYPRIGARRELKRALENYWRGAIAADELRETASELRLRHWQLQREAGLDDIPSNDFSLYDHVLDTATMVGAVPSRFGWEGGRVDLDTYFAMARGVQEKDVEDNGESGGQGAAAMEMTKWYDTNYHYIVPEFEAGQSFALSSTKPVDEFIEAREAGIVTRPVLLGPVTFLLLGKAMDPGLEPLTLLGELLPVYEEVLRRLDREGAEWIQLDEPHLVQDLNAEERAAMGNAYRYLNGGVENANLLVATYYGELGDNLDLALSLPVSGLHVDLVRAPDQVEHIIASDVPEGMSISLGIVDGRNVWRNDLADSLETADRAVDVLGSDRVMVGPSCSLLHVPVDLDLETNLDAELTEWLAFAKQKVREIALLARGLNEGPAAIADAMAENHRVMDTRERSEQIHDPDVQERLSKVDESMFARSSPYSERIAEQSGRLDLPPLPTTTIGSFPQTDTVRKARAAYKRGDSTEEEYHAFLREEIERTIEFQEEIGLDVLVHGESERSDMVEYFAQQLTGIAFTDHGWVQSYGSRCVRPPIIYGDVRRPNAMTVDWTTYAQSLTRKPVKGILTGPVTILQWSFVRDDQPRQETCRQIALAIRDEVLDLEKAGIRAIQVDEPALREGLPLRRSAWKNYLSWAVDCFRLATSGVGDGTQIHTHMCYSEFNDIIEAIARMDADVISIESSRSKMELLDAFAEFDYPNEIGPGVYDIHSPRVPEADEMADLIRRALEVLSIDQVWINPDCGLKTRRWEEVRPALRQMVKAAESVRADL